MENVVFLELRRKYRENESLFYYSTEGGKEIDFLIKNDGVELLEITYDLDQKHVKRMLRAMDELGVKEGTIVTWDTEDVVERKGRVVRAVPLWKWLLSS